MPEQRSRPRDSRVIALANQKGGTGKTTTTVNLGIGLARLGKKVLLIDADPQGDLTTCLGWQDQDSLQTTLATVMEKVIRDEPFTTDEGILHHSEGVDLMPANIELSALEVSLVNAMSREFTLRTYVKEAKKNYDVVIIDCMPSLGMITIKSNALNFNLPSVDDLFSTEESRAEDRLERVVNLNPAEISDFPNHPFKVRMDAAMQEMAESVKQYGVLVPALVRPKRSGGYEMVAGHRRKTAADLAGLAEIPCIVRNLTDEEATIIMVDSNLQREQILPSEKAFAYKMKLDAMKRQAGRPSKENSRPVGADLIGTRSDELLAKDVPDSARQIQRYIRLTNLVPEILELVDNSVLKDPEMLQIALRPAVELSYLRKEEQADLFSIMDERDCTPSHAQAIKMRQMSEAKTGGERLAKDALVSIMKEEKPNQKEQFKIPKEKLSRYFAPGTPAQKIEDTIIKALELYRKRQRSLER